MHSRNKSGSRNFMESLEPRLLLAGDVTVSVSDGILSIFGDEQDNSIIIEQLAGSTDIVIRSGDDTTTINGQTLPVTVDDVTSHIGVSLLGGNDTLEINDVIVNGRLSTNLGTGDNAVTIDTVSVSSTLRIRHSTGDDTTTLTGVNVDGTAIIYSNSGENVTTVTDGNMRSLAILAGSGTDTVTITGIGTTGGVSINNASGDSTTQITGSLIQGNLTIRARVGTDAVVITDTDVRGRVVVDLGTGQTNITISASALGNAINGNGNGNGNGDDNGNGDNGNGNGEVRDVIFRNNDGVSTVIMDDVAVGRNLSMTLGNGTGSTINLQNGTIVGRDLNLRTRAGDDTIAIQDVRVERRTSIDSGSGNDRICIDNSTLDASVMIRTRSGDDVLNIARNGDAIGTPVTFNSNLNVMMEDGDDIMAVGSTAGIGNTTDFERRFTADGGQGTNTLFLPDGINTFNFTQPTIRRFQTVTDVNDNNNT